MTLEFITIISTFAGLFGVIVKITSHLSKSEQVNADFMRSQAEVNASVLKGLEELRTDSFNYRHNHKDEHSKLEKEIQRIDLTK